MKDLKKFSANCYSVDDKKSRIGISFIPVIGMLILIWIIPKSLKTDIRKIFSYIQSPICVISNQIDKLERAINFNTLSKSDLIKFSENLMRENLAIKSQLLSTGRKVSESENLYIDEFLVKPGRVIRRDLATWTNELIINVGSRDGVKIGMGVVSKNYVIGKIKSVDAKTAVVELISNPQFRMVVKIAGDVDMTPIIFSGNDKVGFNKYLGRATNIPSSVLHNADVIELVSSNLSGIFPENIPVGQLKPNVSLDEEFYSADVELNGDIFSKIYEVFVLINPDGE